MGSMKGCTLDFSEASGKDQTVFELEVLGRSRRRAFGGFLGGQYKAAPEKRVWSEVCAYTS